jgi:transcriptional regulator with XRE-family HTH domain
MNLSNAKALRKAREYLRMTKVELANRMKFSVKSVDRAETGEMPMTEERLRDFLSALGIGEEHFLRAKKGKPLLCPLKREKFVIGNIQRRSYRKKIANEVQVLRALRKMRGRSQDQASSVSGYSRRVSATSRMEELNWSEIASTILFPVTGSGITILT